MQKKTVLTLIDLGSGWWPIVSLCKRGIFYTNTIVCINEGNEDRKFEAVLNLNKLAYKTCEKW